MSDDLTGPAPEETRPVRRLRDYPRRNLTDPRTYLTRRQREILVLVANGHTNRSAGERLGIAEDSVKSQMQLTLRKLRVHDRAQAVAVSLALGVLDLEDVVIPQHANRGYRDSA